MKKKKHLIGIFLILSIISCQSKEDPRVQILRKIMNRQVFSELRTNKNYLSKEKFYAEEYLNEWGDFELPEELESIVKKYFNGIEYRVISNWDIEGNGKLDYLVVQPELSIYKGVVKAILIQEDEKIKFYFNINRGFYGPNASANDKSIWSFEKAGISPREVKAIRIQSFDKEFEINKEKLLEIYERCGDKLASGGHGFFFQIIDQSNYLFASTSPFDRQMIEGSIRGILQNPLITYEVFTLVSEKEEYKVISNSFVKYRKLKKQGKAFKILNVDPNDPSKEFSGYNLSTK